MKKPMGITILRKRDIPHILWPLNMAEMHGVGSKTAEKLRGIGIETIGDLAQSNEIQIKALLGINGQRLRERANGIDRRPVDPDAVYDFKSIGNSTTLPKDIANQQELIMVLDRLSEQVASRMRRKQVLAEVVGITIRYKNRKTITRSHKLENPIDQKEDIFREARQLFIKNWDGNPVRLLGITGTGLVEADSAVKQLDLFSYEKDAEKEHLLSTMSRLQEKYGSSIIGHAARRLNAKEGPMKTGQDTSFNKDFLQEKNRGKPKKDC
jgi:DNA polymerase-4